MIRYVHGSEDSLDVDVFYVFDEMPSFKECQEFCSDKEENRNIIVVKNGLVVDCYKGTVDEINNGLIMTYSLHDQDHDLIITRPVKRDALIKMVRAVRCFLSHCSRTQYRSLVKDALRSPSWKTKLEAIRNIDFASISDFGKNGSKEDVYKIFAFQIGQATGLFFGYELYTKSSIAVKYPALRKYLYREKNTNVDDLIECLNVFLTFAENYETIEENGVVHFPYFNKTIDLVKEEYVD